MKHLTLFIILFAFIVLGCKQNTKSESEISNEVPESELTPIETEIPESEDGDYAPQSVNDELAEKIKTFITSEYLKGDELQYIPIEQRKFQLYQIDLNNDGNNEIFVNFLTSYFCGTGGCNILILSHDFKKITNFSVTRTPLFVESTLKNDWKIILVRSEGELKELVFKNGTYPSNPSIVAKAPYDAPSGNAEIMFDDIYSKAKTYEF